MEILPWNKNTRPTEAEVKQVVRDSGLSAMRWEGAPHKHWEGHFHGLQKTLWCAAGDIVFHIDDKDIAMKPGDRLVLPANTIHTADAGGDGVVCFESPPLEANTTTHV